MKNLKEKFMNASFKTRLFVTSAIASVVSIGTPTFADEMELSEVRAASTNWVVTALNELKTGASGTIDVAMPVLFSIAALLMVAFGTFKLGKRFLGKAI